MDGVVVSWASKLHHTGAIRSHCPAELLKIMSVHICQLEKAQTYRKHTLKAPRTRELHVRRNALFVAIIPDFALVGADLRKGRQVQSKQLGTTLDKRNKREYKCLHLSLHFKAFSMNIQFHQDIIFLL